MGVNVAVVGATGAVGDLMRRVLVEQKFPVKTIRFLASEKSAGKTVEFAGKSYAVEAIHADAFRDVQIVLSSTPSSVSVSPRIGNVLLAVMPSARPPSSRIVATMEGLISSHKVRTTISSVASSV